MSALGTAEEVAGVVSQLARDVSVFAPPVVGIVALALGEGASVVASVLKALESGAPEEGILIAIEGAMRAASDAQMAAKLKG